LNQYSTNKVEEHYLMEKLDKYQLVK